MHVRHTDNTITKTDARTEVNVLIYQNGAPNVNVNQDGKVRIVKRISTNVHSVTVLLINIKSVPTWKTIGVVNPAYLGIPIRIVRRRSTNVRCINHVSTIPPAQIFLMIIAVSANLGTKVRASCVKLFPPIALFFLWNPSPFNS